MYSCLYASWKPSMGLIQFVLKANYFSSQRSSMGLTPVILVWWTLRQKDGELGLCSEILSQIKFHTKLDGPGLSSQHWEGKARGSEIQGLLLLYIWFNTCLWYHSPWSRGRGRSCLFVCLWYNLGNTMKPRLAQKSVTPWSLAVCLIGCCVVRSIQMKMERMLGFQHSVHP